MPYKRMGRILLGAAAACVLLSFAALPAARLGPAQAYAARAAAAPGGSSPTAGAQKDAEGGGDAADVEIQRRFNQLRSELLDDRAKTIGWWLSGAALLLALAAIGVAGTAFFTLRTARALEKEARRNAKKAKAYAEEARRLAEEVRERQGSSDEPLRVMLAPASMPLQSSSDDYFGADPGRAGAPAIAEARVLAEEGRIDEAIERWRQIASVAEGRNSELAALAFRSIGDLIRKRTEGDRA